MDDNIRKKLSKERLSPEELKKELKKSKMYFLEDSCKELILEGITSIEEYQTIISTT